MYVCVYVCTYVCIYVHDYGPLYMYVCVCVCSVGDAMCSIAACTSFPEPFIIPPGQKRLAFSHKKLAGHRASDHMAMLNAFYQWQRAR